MAVPTPAAKAYTLNPKEEEEEEDEEEVQTFIARIVNFIDPI